MLSQLWGKKLFTFFIHLSPLQYQLRLAIEQTRNINMVKTFKILNKKAKYKSKSTLMSKLKQNKMQKVFRLNLFLKIPLATKT